MTTEQLEAIDALASLPVDFNPPPRPSGVSMSAPICFLDTETDGVHPDRKVWEVAIIRREPDGTEQEWSTFVDIDLRTADPFGLGVGRFYERHPQGRYLSGLDEFKPYADLWDATGVFSTRDEVADKVAQLTHGAHIVGAVPNFDSEVLDTLLRSSGVLPGWHYHLVDIESLAVGFIAGQGLGKLGTPWKSDELNVLLGLSPIPDEERHTALGDARWVRTMYDRIFS